MIALAAAAPAHAARGDISLAGRLSLPNAVFVSDVWGFESGGREYAVVGDWFGDKAFIVDATDPSAMTIVSEIAGVPAFDLKVWGSYLYLCDGDSRGDDSRVVDISDPSAPVVLPDRFFSAHNISVSAAGTMALSSPGLRLLDLGADPARPELRFEEYDPFTPGARFDGHDTTPRGTLLFDFGGQDPTSIWDVSNPSAPVRLGQVQDASIVYHHSGDVSADGNTLFICDELGTHPTADITGWNISDPASPVRIASIADAGATVHNLYISGDLMYVAYYTAGLKVIDVANTSAPVVLDTWDTSALSGEGIEGAFGVYPFTASGHVYVSDIDNGLFVFSVDDGTLPRTDARGAIPAPGISLEQNAPNPFNPETTIAFHLDRPAHAELRIFDTRGSLVRTLVSGALEAGAHRERWDGTDDRGHTVASGVYFYRLNALGERLTRRMLLLK